MKNKLFIRKKNKIRIIAGKWRGKKIPVINSPIVRPTTSRIRETLFNWLHPIILDSICLDCFAGSGSLGIESLSRGAQKVTFIDKNRNCINSIIKTLQSFQYNNTIFNNTIHSDCRNWLKKSNNTSYNIIFIDPPFAFSAIIPEIIWLLEHNNHLKKESWIYIETSKNCNFFNVNDIPKNWFLYKKKNTSSITIYLYYRHQNPPYLKYEYQNTQS